MNSLPVNSSRMTTTSVETDPDAWIHKTCLDIASETDASLTRLAEFENVDDMPPSNSVLSAPDNLWENGKTLSYAFLGPSSGTKLQQEKVRKVITMWQDYANIKFSRTEDVNSAIIRISFIASTSSWSHIGKKIKEIKDVSKPTMNLGWIGDTETITDQEKGVILHEFGHVLGMLHEHQSPAIGGLITLKETAVREAFVKTKKWTPQQVDEQILKPYSENELTNFTEFDLKSIMLYYMPKEMNNEGIEIKPNNTLSKFDKAFAAIHYPFFGPNPPAKPDARIDHALKILGFEKDSDAVKQVMELHQNGDTAAIREKVRDLYAAVRDERQKLVVKKLSELAEGE